MKTVVLFDGVCNLCHRTVQFILRHDKSQRFVFASQQSEVGQQLLRRYGIPTETALADSVVVVEEGRVWLESDAALHILYRLGGVWRIPALLRWVPKGLRDWVYRLIAKNRYRLFGRLERCMVPTPELKKRFLDSL
ncbi:thiol-disulfide oxidoreductase DCC family protein [Meiothermus taiwanensis]|jgi:predicted DCC family thiol-disulfide oxidoreductase YuxK|uniref:Thiol-disulfide oxidoreductase DCC n=1 Tax=Meiothermus taiwanensis WR-220 TaxID=1339250 RepID=A0ABM6WKY7_9DEIN|nr:thiol-disulfide oxidoreductase DCC family protein [Meiothermus taiwanensis]AWR87813.1 putative thiol-disulfide oxidoreductase DCC [Meiothermus taiwanensis WR-220]KIQ54181.1 thiol-disulfide oxidoreductase DCC [Meiothermus taiwanensis]KZK16240.1 thiol-disulfide oxidoreductase DCC [Meiothermus taiwanensis]